MEARDRLASGLQVGAIEPGLLAGPAQSCEIELLIALIMQQCAQDAEDDLRAILAEMQARLAAKKALRDLISRVNRDRLANEARHEFHERLDYSQGLGSKRAYHRVLLPMPDPEAGLRWVPTDLAGGKLTCVEQFDCIVAELQSKLDSLSEMSEMTTLRLQMMLDRRSKFLEAVSNIMKKISALQAAVVQNLK
jgi:hypothetical protein